jgi:putative oxidoreductase
MVRGIDLALRRDREEDAMDGRNHRFQEITYALMRFFLGVLLLCHGTQKLLGAFGGHKITGQPLLTAAGIIELVGGSLVALGLFTKIAAFITAGEMAAAYFIAHAPKGFWPILNKGELAVALCFAFLFIAAYGGGRYSLDKTLRRRRALVV